MQESSEKYFMVTGRVTTKKSPGIDQRRDVLQAIDFNACRVGWEVNLAKNNALTSKIQFIAKHDKAILIIDYIVAILEPIGIEYQEWFQIEATRLIPNKKEG